MSDDQNQQLSALVDGEQGPTTLPSILDALEHDTELAARWGRYHLISAALRGEPVRHEFLGVAPAVAARLAAEPTVLAPRRRRPALLAAAIGPLAGAGLAATAAFVAVFAVPVLNELDPGSGAAPPATRVAVGTQRRPPQFTLEGSSQRWHISEPDIENKLDRFLVNHQEMAPASGIKGLLPYATFVGYEAGR